MHKKLFYTGVLTYVLLFIFSIVFYKERILFTDSAYLLFKMVKDGSYAVQHMRFGMLLIQTLPVAAIKAGLSLQIITIVYSGSFVLYYLTCFLLCTKVFESNKMGLVLLLFNVLVVSHSFYWMISELPQGIAFMLVYFAYVEQRPTKKISGNFIITTIPILVIIAFFHPLIFIPFFYLLFFMFIDTQDRDTRKMLLFIAIVFIVTLLIKKTFFKVHYDSISAESIRNIKHLFPDYLDLYANKVLLQNTGSYYYWLPILVVLIGVYYITHRKPLKLLLSLASIFGYLFLINICYPDIRTPDFYIENLYLPVGLLAAIPFVFDVLPLLERKKLAVFVIGAICITGCIRIYRTHEKYTARLNWERNFLAQHPNRKILIDAKYTPQDTLMMAWATPFEFWLLSTIETGKTASVLISKNIGSDLWKANTKNGFATTWEVYPYQKLDKAYFRFTDTTNSYTTIK